MDNNNSKCMSCTKLSGRNPEFNLACSHRGYHTYEKSVDYACVSAMVFCVAFKLLGSSVCGRLFRRRLPSLFLHPLVVLVGLSAAITYSRARAHSRGRSEGCPFTRPTVLGSVPTRAYQPQRTYTDTARDFSSIHTA